MLLTSALSSVSTIAMVPLSDDELSDVTGQALLMMGMREGVGISKDLKFYRAGLDAIVELNANFEKLQLGCGGINGAGCDIDIDHFSLSGPEPVNGWSSQNERAASDAILTRPFFEFAIKNDGTPHREIVGFRLSSEMAEGVLTAGQNDGTSNGINTLSGYMEIAPTSGTTKTKQTFFDNTLEGLMTTGSCGTGLGRQLSCTGFRTTGGGITIPQVENVEFHTPFFVVNRSRVESLTIENIMASITRIPIRLADGSFKAQVVALSATDGTSYNNCLFVFVCGTKLDNVRMQTNLVNLPVNITFEQSLGLIHKIPVKNPFSLSMQSEGVRWPDFAPANIAQRGWWMSFSDPIELGDLSTPEGYEVDISGVLSQVASNINNHFKTRSNAVKVPFTDAVGAVFTGNLDLDLPDINMSSNQVYLSLSDLPLGVAQNVVPNCYGSAAFC